MKALVNAYACCPGMGSEPGMGWNWCLNLAKHCELFIITEGEFRAQIESALPGLEQADNMHFYFLPVSGRVRRMCWNQGDWRFYFHYRRWQKKALNKALEICRDNDIDLVHQLNMIGFREPGYLWKLGKPMVWGPIGGVFEPIDKFMSDAPVSLKIKQRAKDCITDLQMRWGYRVNQAIKHSGSLISAVPAVQNSIFDIKQRTSLLIPETGCYTPDTEAIDKRKRLEFKVLWVGKFSYRKRLDLALRAIAQVKDIYGLEFHIAGTGTTKQSEMYRALSKNLGIDTICIWHGQVDNSQVHDLMRDSDLFLFTSIREATSTVVTEAINNCLPVVCFDACGFGPLITESIGRKVALSSPEQAVQEFTEQIRTLHDDKEILYEMSCNCKEALKELLWEDKARRVFEIYKTLTNQTPHLLSQKSGR